MTGIIGANVRRLRTAAGMSQEKLAQAMGVHQSTVTYWENTHTWSPEGEDALKLCAIFGVEVGEFFKVFGESEPQEG